MTTTPSPNSTFAMTRNGASLTGASATEELLDPAHDGVDLLLRHSREDRQREEVSREVLRDGEGTRPPAEARVRRCEVRRLGVMAARLHAPLGEELGERVRPLGPH